MQYTYQDEDSIDISLLCRICRLPLVDPVFHVDCGNTFCKNCLHDVSHCPSCREPITNTMPSPKMVIDLLDRLKVICPSCKEVYDRGVLLDHINNCPAPCVEGCGEMVSPRERNDHTEACLYQKVSCPSMDVGCEWKGRRKEMEGHTKICQWIPMRVPLLEIIKLRKDHGNEIDKLKKESIELKENHGKEIAQIKEHHERAIFQLKENQEKEIDKLNMEILQLKGKVEHLEKKPEKGLKEISLSKVLERSKQWQLS